MTQAGLHDYVSPGLKTLHLDDYFPNMIAGDMNDCGWRHLRRDSPHLWYCDRRAASVGFLNRDEAHILYNIALRFVGAEALAIGCSMGWSVCHMAAGGVTLDVVDPLLAADWVRQSVTESVAGTGMMNRVKLYAAASPDALDVLGGQGRRWSLMFIDGDHEFPGPMRNAVSCERWAAAGDAAIVLHNVRAPAVADAVYFLKDRGWNIRLYQTAQLMAVAWRGAVSPVNHVPDPHAGFGIPDHLQAAA